MEGPSLLILLKEIQFLENQKIIDVYGNASFDKKLLKNKKIYEIYTYGKRLILQFKRYTVVIHFLMYGSYRINQQRENMTPRLALITKAGALYLYNCSIKLLEETDFKKTIDTDFDIVSDTWDIKKVVRAMKKYPQKTIDDILLDQSIFAGVGNIIKNETLFLSKISPLRKVSRISDKKLAVIAQNARDFSLNFLAWRLNFELMKHVNIYRKSYCPVCHTKLLRKKTGTYQRISFWCPVCQKS